MPGSRNKVIVDTLIATIQQKDAKLYEALNKMAQDLNACYTALFDGPLPAVDGNALTNLNALNITGVIPEVNLPANIAFQDRANSFTEENTFVLSQFFEDEEGAISLAYNNGSDPITSRFNLGVRDEGKFYLGCNLFFESDAPERDDTGLDSIALEFENNVINFLNYGPTTAEPGGEFFYSFIIEGKEIRFNNVDQDDEFSAIYIDDNDVIRLGADSDETGLPNGHIAIPTIDFTELPDADAIADGILVTDKTNNRICFYANGNRYYVAGTLF